MSGILQIKRGTVDPSVLQSGEFYVKTNSCKVQIGTQNGDILTLVPLNCVAIGDITLIGTITATSFVGNLTGNVTGNLTGLATNATSASWADNAGNANTATSASWADNAGNANFATNTTSASWADNSVHANTATSASWADNSGHANTATSASWADNAGHSLTSTSASWADNSGYANTATSASWADNSAHSINSDTASYIGVALYTASANLNVITFTKGNGNQFNVILDTGSIIQTDLLVGTTQGQILYNSGGKIGSISSLTYDGTLLRATGSFSGSFFGTLSGSLYGTASWAYSASQALTASYVLTAKTASYISSSNVWGPHGWDSIQTASLALTASFVTASNVWGPYGTSSVYSASYSVSSSYAEVSSRTLFCEVVSSSYPFDVTGSTIFSYNTEALDGTSNLIIGDSAGKYTSAEYSLLFGGGSGFNSKNLSNAIFIGSSAGNKTSEVINSNFIGYQVGMYTSASYSNFIGSETAYNSKGAQYSNFIGYNTGKNTFSASYSTLIGYQVGYKTTQTSGRGIGDNNIIIGTNITLPQTQSNSINIGGILFGSGTYSDTTSDPYEGSANGKIGINIVNPEYTLDVSGSEQLYNYLKFLESGSDPGTQTGANAKSTYLFTSASNNQNGSDLYIRHADNLTKWKWLEGKLNTGLLYGGVLSYNNGQNGFTMSAGAGIIVNHNATTSSEHTPVITYVNWPETSQPITNISTEANTYVYVGTNGTITQQTEFFSPDQYRQLIPIGRISHYNRQSVNGVATHINTAYDVDRQQNIALRVLGPLKISGFDTTASGSSLKFGLSTGEAFVLGDYYKEDPNNPSYYKNNTTYQSASIVRIWKSGSSFTFDNNGGNYYTTIDPSQYNITATGTTASVANNDWSVQRVMVNPVSGRAHVYYGQATYGTKTEAVAAISSEAFEEDTSTANSYVLSAYIVARGAASNLSDTVDAKIVKAGIFRSTAGGGGAGGATALAQLSDVNLGTLSNGQALVYNSTSTKWENKTLIKAASGSTTDFTGLPYTTSVSFGSAFTDNLYSVTVTGEDLRVWSIQSKTSAGFTINSNSSVKPNGTVYWIASSFNS
jgi:hypothetical protein